MGIVSKVARTALNMLWNNAVNFADETRGKIDIRILANSAEDFLLDLYRALDERKPWQWGIGYYIENHPGNLYNHVSMEFVTNPAGYRIFREVAEKYKDYITDLNGKPFGGPSNQSPALALCSP